METPQLSPLPVVRESGTSHHGLVLGTKLHGSPATHGQLPAAAHSTLSEPLVQHAARCAATRLIASTFGYPQHRTFVSFAIKLLRNTFEFAKPYKKVDDFTLTIMGIFVDNVCQG